MVGVESLENIWGKITFVPFAADALAQLQPCPNADLSILQDPHDVTLYTIAVSYDYKGSKAVSPASMIAAVGNKVGTMML